MRKTPDEMLAGLQAILWFVIVWRCAPMVGKCRKCWQVKSGVLLLWTNPQFSPSRTKQWLGLCFRFAQNFQQKSRNVDKVQLQSDSISTEWCNVTKNVFSSHPTWKFEKSFSASAAAFFQITQNTTCKRKNFFFAFFSFWQWPNLVLQLKIPLISKSVLLHKPPLNIWTTVNKTLWLANK